MAGTSRMKQPATVHIVRLPCSGRVNPLLPVKALLEGADGVLVSGCHPGSCHYREGNLYARRRLEVLKNLLPFLGYEPQRFRYVWVSASEGQKWQQVVTEFSQAIQELGPVRSKEQA